MARFNRYLVDTRAELRKVVWPTREQAVNLTLAVLFVTLLMTLLLGGVDFVFARLLEWILGATTGCSREETMDVSIGQPEVPELIEDPAATAPEAAAVAARAPRASRAKGKRATAAAEAQDAGEAADHESEAREVDSTGTEEAHGPDAVDIPEGAEWYVLHTYSGYENKVKRNLEHRIESMGMHDQIFQIVVPVEEEVDIKDGQRRIVERKIFPGYVLVRMIMNDESYSVVRDTPAVTNFVGSIGTESERNRPTPLRGDEVDRILRRMEAEEPAIRVSFRPGQNVRIVDGPFTDFHGVVDAIDVERGKVRLMVNFFGRETPVELDFLQVEKV